MTISIERVNKHLHKDAIVLRNWSMDGLKQRLVALARSYNIIWDRIDNAQDVITALYAVYVGITRPCAWLFDDLVHSYGVNMPSPEDLEALNEAIFLLRWFTKYMPSHSSSFDTLLSKMVRAHDVIYEVLPHGCSIPDFESLDM